MSERFRPEQHLRKAIFFRIVFEKGKRSKGRVINLWVCETAQLGETQKSEKPKLGVIVSRKTDLRATRRNLWKRRIREVFRKEQHQMREGITVLVQSKKQNAVPSYEDISKEMKHLLAALGALKAPGAETQ